MSKVKFYIDKADKQKLVPIHLVIRIKGVHIKVATGEKIKKKDWIAKQQMVGSNYYPHKSINNFLGFLRKETEKYLQGATKAQLTNKKIKEKIQSLVNSRKANTSLNIVCEEDSKYSTKERVTFIDLFAGAGGFSEGFLQAEYGNKIYDFLLGSDINENCELTHIARYNHQLGLDMAFLRQDITEPNFLDNLLQKVNDRQVDVVCGGPPCQSFSLAGKRKKYDKKDDLFSHYLKVIRQLRPKYFVMENVKGILTKEGGKIKEMILQEIRSIIDFKEFHKLLFFVEQLRKSNRLDEYVLSCYLLRMRFESAKEKELHQLKNSYIENLELNFKNLTPKIADYKASKTDSNISTIRHGLNLLKRNFELEYIRKKVINEKAKCDLDNDLFSDDFNDFLATIEPLNIVEKITLAFKNLKPGERYQQEVNNILRALDIYVTSFDSCVEELKEYANKAKRLEEFENILSEIRLYKINQPFVALASNYGVPQNRERVLFIGCRKDQKLISDIPATVKGDEKVTVFEALYDLDFLGNDEERFNYERVNIERMYNGSSKKMLQLVRKRDIDGKVEDSGGMTYAEWSKKGRLNGRFGNITPGFYVRNFEELDTELKIHAQLHNHKTSNQNEDVIKRLEIILGEGDYDDARKKLKKLGLDSEKRNYNVLRPDSQSPTVLTMPDDYIHFRTPRALTVREMARLQSFDDSFVFQGKRSTGGNKRKDEVPQYTLVGNAVPPLMARAAALEVLKNIR